MAKHLLHYRKGSANTSITYPRGTGTAMLSGYCDADWGGSDNRKSTSGYIFLVNGAPISWSSKCQPTVALSSTEAIWLHRLFNDLGHPQGSPTVIHEDNQSCIKLSKNPIQHQRTKHIDVQTHFIREKID
jgi:hypothetical protein